MTGDGLADGEADGELEGAGVDDGDGDGAGDAEPPDDVSPVGLSVPGAELPAVNV